MRLDRIVAAAVVAACGATSVDSLVRRVETRCELAVDAPRRLLRVSAPHGNWSSDAPSTGFEARIATAPLLCAVAGAGAAGPLALLSLATDPGYLASTKTSAAHGTSLRILDALEEKRKYASRQNLELFVWLGALGDGALQGDRSNCGETSRSNGHALKILAMLVVFRCRPTLEALIYADADALPALRDVAPATYLELAPAADVVGGANPGLPIVMNSGLLLVRNTAWARDLLGRWWALRCGFFDQYSLWKALFEAWKRDAGFAYDAAIFADYSAARRGALGAVVEGLGTLAGARWPLGGDARAVFAETGCLVEPLELPKVLLLPVMPFLDGQHLIHPLQGRVDAGYWDAWFCAFRRVRPDARPARPPRRPQATASATPRTRRGGSTSRGRTAATGTRGPSAPCAATRRRATFRGASSPGARRATSATAATSPRCASRRSSPASRPGGRGPTKLRGPRRRARRPS